MKVMETLFEIIRTSSSSTDGKYRFFFRQTWMLSIQRLLAVLLRLLIIFDIASARTKRGFDNSFTQTSPVMLDLYNQSLGFDVGFISGS